MATSFYRSSDTEKRGLCACICRTQVVRGKGESCDAHAGTAEEVRWKVFVSGLLID